MPASSAACSTWANAPKVCGPSKVGRVRRDPRVVDLDVDEADDPAGRGALAHAVPVVDDADAGRGALDPGHVQRAVRPEVREDRDPVREQGPGAVALLAVEEPAGRPGPRGRVSVVKWSRTVLVPSSDWALPNRRPCEHLAEEERPLGRRAVVTQHVDVDEVAVRDLGDARVPGGEQREHLGHHLGGQVRAAVRRGHGDAQQAGPRQRLELAGRQDPLAVALGGPDGELVAQVAGRRQRRRASRTGTRVPTDSIKDVPAISSISSFMSIQIVHITNRSPTPTRGTRRVVTPSESP